MKKNNFFTFSLITMLIAISPILLQAQRKIYIGVETGLGIANVRAINTIGNNYETHKASKVAASGICFGIETANHFFLEFAVSGQTFTNQSIKYKSDDYGFAQSGGNKGMFTTSLRLRYELRFTTKFSVFPTLALHVNRLDQPSEKFNEGRIVSSGSSIVNGVTVYDSLFMATIFYTNRTTIPEAGFDLAYSIFPRMQACFGTYLTLSNEIYASAHVIEFRTNEPETSAKINYGGKELSFKVGFRWHLANLSKVDTKVW